MRAAETTFTAPVAAPALLVTAVAAAEGSRPAAAALACAAAELDRAALLVDVGGRPPRPTLLASAAAQALEERIAAHLPEARVAARGAICQLAVAADAEGTAQAGAAMTLARQRPQVIHLPATAVQALLDGPLAPRLGGALLRAEPDAERPLLALAVRDLLGRGLRVAVLKRRLPWTAERRALFGALGADATLPPPIRRKLLSETCYGHADGSHPSPQLPSAAPPPRQDDAGAGPR